MFRFNPFAAIGFDDNWFGADSGFGSGGAELGEERYQGRTADESRPGWTPNPQAFDPFNDYLAVDPYTGKPISKMSPAAEKMLRLGFVIDEDVDPHTGLPIMGPPNFPEAYSGAMLAVAIDASTIDSILNILEMPLPESSDTASKDTPWYCDVNGKIWFLRSDGTWADSLSEEITVVAHSEPPSSPPTRDWTTSPTGPAPPSVPSTIGWTPSPAGSAAPWSAPPTRDSAFNPAPTRSGAPSPASGERAERANSRRAQIIPPLPPISGSRDALLYNPTPSYWRYLTERGDEASNKPKPDFQDIHTILDGMIAAPLALPEKLLIGIINLPHEVVNRATHGGEHLGRGYSLAVERGEYAEAYAEYLDAFIDLSVGFLNLASLAKPGSPGKPLASLGPKLETSLPAAEVRLAGEAEALATEGVSEGSWIRLSRSRVEADAFNRSVQQVRGELQRPPNKLGGGPNKWGSTFNNRALQPGRPPELPIALGPYKEYTALLPGQTTRGELRTVIGGNGEIFTTWTHYGTSQPFFPIDPLEQLERVTFLRSR